MIHLLILNNRSIGEQLTLEEKLLRTTEENWCILNTNSPRTIVMGLSADPQEVIHMERVRKDSIPVIRRFSGGGTVITDENTLFATFIFQKDAHPFPPYPKSILDWTGSFYKNALSLPEFAVQGNDYALGNRKIGGNAQYIRKNRWLHHTSFLWDYQDQNFDYLHHPPKEPTYRRGRSHTEFLTRLKPFLSKEEFQNKVITHLSKLYDVTPESALKPFENPANE